MERSNLFDLRSELWRSSFERGLNYQDFLLTGTESQKRKYIDVASKLTLTAQQITLLATFKRQMNLLVLSGIWCGDCSRQCPIINLCETNSNVITVRYFEVNNEEALAQELRIQGAARVPIVLCLSEDYWEVGRFGDRTLSAYRRKAQREVGLACDSGIIGSAGSELTSELAEWLNILERWQLILRTSPFLRQRHRD